MYFGYESRRTFGGAVLGCCALLIATVPTLGATDEYKFTNKTGEHANDLHFTISPAPTFFAPAPIQTPADTFKFASGSGATTINLRQGSAGVGVANGSSVVINLNYDGSKPAVQKARWTKGNTLNPRAGDWLGNILKIDNKKNEYASVPATGDGQTDVTIDGATYSFFSEEGDAAAATATRFAAFVETIPFGGVLEVTADSVTYTGFAYDNIEPNITVEVVQQDSTQTVTVSTITVSTITESIPTVSEWGLIVMTLLMLTAGTVVIGRRRRPASA